MDGVWHANGMLPPTIIRSHAAAPPRSAPPVMPSARQSFRGPPAHLVTLRWPVEDNAPVCRCKHALGAPMMGTAWHHSLQYRLARYDLCVARVMKSGLIMHTTYHVCPF